MARRTIKVQVEWRECDSTRGKPCVVCGEESWGDSYEAFWKKDGMDWDPLGTYVCGSCREED